jgi:hypothetical protein
MRRAFLHRTETICAPVNGAIVPTKLLLAAGATDSNSVAAMKVYVEGLRGWNFSFLYTSAALQHIC